jgi:type II secretory ATPase GspE/PulE/Tfp pilus assembly ATPase PilB-like protein
MDFKKRLGSTTGHPPESASLARGGPPASSALGPPGAPEEVGVIKKLEEILQGGLAQGATEIHLDPLPERTRVRYRVQGKMVELPENVDAKLHQKLISRIKVIGLMDISKRGVAQKGYSKIEHDGQSFEMVIMVVPAQAGEKAMFKIGYTTTLGTTLERLGMFTKVLASFKKLLERPNGLVLMAGPPGSGRTTTCYSALTYLNTPEKAVYSFEPEIRYQIEGVLQGKPEPRYEYGYLDGVRATLDLEPDVFYIGDLNGEDVARLAVGAAFGKRIVLGRLNAKNGATALMSLLDMGLAPFLVTSGVVGVVSQRLVRRLCEACRQPYVPSETVLTELSLNPNPELKFYSATGCDECEQSGFKGKIGLFEVLVLSETVQEKVLARASAAEIQEAAVESGMMTLRLDGVSKVTRGLTTIEEVLAAT